ncbi:fimbrial protein [Pseudomonas sp. DTU_2021_1001937_2_SI_NGA_ILE_001]|uniref:fimbrial protein n=1 Tax=Pseudomonas sp. DTU_2021_1001937_2_SI_NGA_ILE_001 TaxID=3077589 RepID=UPI0025DFAD56|nr:fimbrial protein [Pseudomonas sp. DTU_2021_1001937_2_SI_NGA_ILE_001]WNW10764.1 fimbrial protein [Pseudomonas sp. DTU_2021_1001937_2_SI_NGA_ILE_001]
MTPFRPRALPWLAAAVCLQASSALADNYCYWQMPAGPTMLSFVQNIGTLYVPRDAPVGTVIGQPLRPAFIQHPGPHRPMCFYKDMNGGNLWFHAQASVPIHPSPLPPIGGEDTTGKILQTSIPGVGAMIRLGTPHHSTLAINAFVADDGRPFVPFTGTRRPHRNPLELDIELYYIRPTVTLVKTGTIPTGPNTLTGSELFGGYVQDLGKVFQYGMTGTVIQAQCSVSANPVSADPVMLGEWDSADFTGPGHTTPVVPFSINLSNCETDPGGPVTTAHLRLDGLNGSQPVGPTSNGVFSLTTDSGAQGVGIQILKADGITPMELATEVPMTTLTPGDMALHFNARFYQTEASRDVRPGLAKGALSFTLTYQ